MNRIFYMAMLLVTWLSFAPSYADNVARIGDVEYASLAEAVAAVPDNSETTIMMIGSEALNAGVTITVPAAYCAEGFEPTEADSQGKYTVEAVPVADPVVTFQMVDDVGKIVIQGLDDNVHTNVFDTWFDGVNNRPNIRVAFTQTVTSGSTATKPTNTPYYDYNITQPNNGNPKNFTNDDSHTYTFDGWATSDGALYDFDTPVTENLTLHPRFSATGATILINNETELRAFAREVELGRKFREQWGEEKQTVKLADDITLTSNWTPVAGFEGIFDGDNHSISGLVISATGDYAGFFSGLNSHTVVKDLTFVSPRVTSTDEYVGVLAGSASSNASTIHPQVSNVKVTGAFSVSGKNNVGALIGQVNNGVKIEDCSVDGTSVASSTIAGNSASGRPIGGLLGNTIGAVTITDCTVENVTVTGARKLGGLIGQIQSNSSNASVTCTGVSVSNVKIVSTAATTFSSALTMGGLVGIFASPFAANSITGTVSDVNMTGPANIADGKVYVMGLVSGGTGDALATAESSMDGAGMTFDVTISGTNTLAVPNESTYAGINGVSPVAKIGNVKYTSLAEAIAAVPDGTQTTITMIADETVADGTTLTIPANKNIVLDLNGKTISGSSSDSNYSFYFLTNRGTLEITDNSVGALGKITYGCSSPNTGYSKEYVTIYNIGGTLTLTEGTVENRSGYLSYAINNSSNAWGNNDDKETVFTMTGGCISAPSGDAALRVYQNCAQSNTPFSHNTVTISGGKIKDTGIFLDNYIYQPKDNTTGDGILTSVTISGGEIHGLIDLKLRHAFNTSLTITGGTFVDSKLWVRKHSEWKNVVAEPTAPIVHISGGKFSFANNKAFGLAYDCGDTSWTSYTQPYDVSGGVFNVDLKTFSGIAFPEGKTGVANTDPTTKTAYPYTVGSEFVAQIGETKYATLAEAIADVPTDGTETTITMIADETINVAGSALTIAAGKNVVLELNGKEVTGVCTTGTASALITNNGTLKIQDNTDTNKDGTGQGKMYAGANPAWIYEGGENYAGSYASNMISNRGNLTIESGYFESTTSGSAAYIIDNYTNGIAVINGGHLYNYHTNAIRLFCNSTSADNSLTVNGGIIEGYCAIWVQGASQTTEKGSLTINGGTFRTTEKAVVNGTKTIAEGNSYIYVWPSNSNMSFTITGGTFDTNIATWGNGSVSISGGTFNGYVYSATQTAFITGGTFAEDVSEYCADGYAAADNNNGAWKVGVVSTTKLTPQAGATETEATYTASTVVTDENNVEYPLSTNQEVNVSVPETGNAGKDVTLADFDMNEVVAKAVAAANTGDNIDVQLIVKAAEPVVSGETVKTVTFEVHPEAIITVNDGEPTNVMLTNDDLAPNATFTFVLDVTDRFNEGDAIKVVHKSEGYEDETFYSTVIDGKVTVSGITHFSDFELSVVDAVAQIGGTEYASLADAFAAVGDGQTITMLIDVVLPEPLNVNLAGKAVTLNLGAHTLTGRTNLKSGSLTLTNGNVAGGDQQALNVYGSSDDPTATNYSVLTIDSKVKVTADVYGVCMFGATASTNGYGAVVNINGTVTTTGDSKNGAVFVSGNLGKNISGDMNNVVNITGKVTSSTDAAVALNGNATVNVQNGAQITGNTGIAVKRGTLNVAGGTIYANGEENTNPGANHNGTEMTGAGISMSSTYNQYGPMSVVITGGMVNSSNAQALFKQDGTYTNSATFSVSGGLFSHAVPKEFCAKGYQPKYDQTTGKYTVATFEEIWAGKDIVLTDGNSYEACVGEPVTQDVVVKSVKYQRNVPNANTYCAWYVPADYKLTSDDLDQFNFYRINLIANAEGGNVVENTDRIWVYLFPMAADDVLTANRPYVFKTKGGTGEFTFYLENTLHAPATDVRLNNSTTAHNYDFYGTYETTELSDNSSEHFFYVDYYGLMGYPGGSNIDVGPYRWYIKTTQKGGGAYYAPTFVFTDDSNVTGITDNLEVKTIDCYYDLKGMKIEKPSKGAYLVKFKDGTVKKVVK